MAEGSGIEPQTLRSLGLAIQPIDHAGLPSNWKKAEESNPYRSQYSRIQTVLPANLAAPSIIGARGEIRTLNSLGLSQQPLPIGLPGHYLVERAGFEPPRN